MKNYGRNAKMPTTEDEWIKVLSAAVDEIYALRVIAADQAQTIEEHLTLKTFPKSRREIAKAQIDALRDAAKGDTTLGYTGINAQAALRSAGADDLLTNWQWLEEKGFTS